MKRDRKSRKGRLMGVIVNSSSVFYYLISFDNIEFSS